MQNCFSSLAKKENQHELILAIILIVYIIFNIKLPDTLSNAVNTPLGMIVIVAVGLLNLIYSNPIVGILGIVVAYLLIERSKQKNLKKPKSMHKYLPTEKKKNQFLTAENQFPKTLEEEVVLKMTNHTSYENPNPASYKPVLDDSLNGFTL